MNHKFKSMIKRVEMRLKTIRSACSVACVTLLIAATAAFAQLFTVASNTLNVRKGPGLRFGVTYVLRRGDQVEVVRQERNWAFIIGERGGEGWVESRFLSSTAASPSPLPPPGDNSTSDVFKGKGTIDNVRYKGSGDAQLVIVRRDQGASFSLTSNDSKVSIEYLGKVRSNFEGTIQLQINQFRSSEMGYRTVAASGTCDIQASAGNLRQSYCTVSGSGIDHGKSNFKAQ
jgi:uncharacterized protein YgiM (DUF1202 family)